MAHLDGSGLGCLTRLQPGLQLPKAGLIETRGSAFKITHATVGREWGDGGWGLQHLPHGLFHRTAKDMVFPRASHPRESNYTSDESCSLSKIESWK